MGTKQKYSQHDLRRLMQEQKTKANAAQSAVKKTKIDSPLAKYIDGQLTCVLCQSVVRSEEVWKVHLNAKQHKDNVIAAKELKERVEKQKTNAGNKRPAPPVQEAVPEKKPKGILKNATPRPVPVATSEVPKPPVVPMEVTEEVKEEGEEVPGDGTALPEGFFDDPKKDAVARNLEYKDPVQEEWDRFQKEIREAATVSNEIIAEDQEESTAERQIVEIDEQIRNWSRVLMMEKRKEERMRRQQERANQKTKVEKIESEDEDDEQESDNDDEMDEDVAFGSWRAKGWQKK